MYALLEPGMKIQCSDEAFSPDENEWVLAGLTAGDIYRKEHWVMRREITTIEDLQSLTQA